MKQAQCFCPDQQIIILQVRGSNHKNKLPNNFANKLSAYISGSYFDNRQWTETVINLTDLRIQIYYFFYKMIPSFQNDAFEGESQSSVGHTHIVNTLIVITHTIW